MLNFYQFVNTHDKKATRLLSENLSGPSKYCLKSLNVRESDSYILDISKDTADVAK